MTNQAFKTSFVYNEDEAYYLYELKDNLSITRLTLNELGSINRFVLSESSTEWAIMYTVQNDLCDNYGHCGANGFCRIGNTPICECLDGFVPKSQNEWEFLNWTSGCIRSTPLDCQKGEGFIEVKGVKLPDLLDFWVNKRTTLRECRAECLKNCSCTAYANSNISKGGSGCLMWFGNLIDVREFHAQESEQTVYVRMPASELESRRNSSQKRKHLVIVVLVSMASVVLILGLGTLGTGQEIAVKRLSNNSGQGLQEFKNEVILISRLQHRNLVRLLGCCIEREERMLIYEYMPNRSLDYFIFDQMRRVLLPWQKRLDIILGIARGLLYLHQDSRLRIIHRDLKTSNILLDSELTPKISDFGIARIFGGDQIEAKTKRVIGTYGYMSPEYAVDGQFSVKSDVFSLGVLLLEIVSGKKNRGFCHPDHYHNLLGHVWLLWNENRALELMEPCLVDSYVESQVLRCIQVGLLCIQKLPEDRPSMSSVVLMLVNEEITLPQP
uniref:G-type lectin S-receptor-like serine/threonine-protein kinase n=1 Tax=Vitis vinifera TaxID=29760 RepID=F6H2A2_VITVI